MLKKGTAYEVGLKFLLYFIGAFFYLLCISWSRPYIWLAVYGWLCKNAREGWKTLAIHLQAKNKVIYHFFFKSFLFIINASASR